MSQPLKGRIKELVKIVKNHTDYLAHNRTLLDIYKGNLLKYIEKALGEQLSNDALRIAIKRIPPINVMSRIIDKQSKIYSNGVAREVTGGSASDDILFQYMGDTIQPNATFGVWNSYFNLFENGLVQPYLTSKGIPAVRVIPSDRFIPFSDDVIDCNTPTGFIIIMGSYADEKGKYTVYMAIDAESFVYFTDREADITTSMEPLGGDGVNPIGVIPYVYINRDRENLIPIQSTDMLAMTLLIPVLLTDINFAHMFQAFSIVYGINLTDKGIKYGPNAFWTFESIPGDDRKPELGLLSPKADIDAGLNLVANQFALWLNTIGIKAGDMGSISAQNFSSGISKVMDEMDTSEDRNEQIPYFQKGEQEFWDLVFKDMLPFWQKRPEYTGIQGVFTPTARVVTLFSEQLPLIRRSQVLDETIKELDAGLTTREAALKRLNPTMSQKQIDELTASIDEEKAANAPAPAVANPGTGFPPGNQNGNPNPGTGGPAPAQ